MNKNELIEDDKMATDDEVEKMNLEYKKCQNSVVQIARFLEGGKCQNHHICTYDFESIARAYFLEKDILTSLNFLHQKTRLPWVKCSIERIIKIKERCACRLLEIYIKGTGNNINYAPNIIDRPTYNALYAEISYMQTTLLARLDDIDGICNIVCSEHTATLILYSIRP